MYIIFLKNKVCILLSLFLLLAFLVYWGFPGGSDGEEFACGVGDWGSIPGLGRSPGGGHGQPTPVFSPGDSPSTEGPGGLQSMRSQSRTRLRA